MFRARSFFATLEVVSEGGRTDNKRREEEQLRGALELRVAAKANSKLTLNRSVQV